MLIFKAKSLGAVPDAQRTTRMCVEINTGERKGVWKRRVEGCRRDEGRGHVACGQKWTDHEANEAQDLGF